MILRRFALCLLLASPILAGCKQGLGERCQVDSDCDEGQNLKCVLPQGGSAAEGGLCQQNTVAAPDMTVVTQDSAVAQDLSQTGGQDQAGATDLTPLMDLLAADGGAGDQ